jgi:hypothetical protein
MLVGSMWVASDHDRQTTNRHRDALPRQGWLCCRWVPPGRMGHARSARAASRRARLCAPALGRVADLHFPPLYAMLRTAAEGERHGLYARAVSLLSQRTASLQAARPQRVNTTLRTKTLRVLIMPCRVIASTQDVSLRCTRRAWPCVPTASGCWSIALRVGCQCTIAQGTSAT